MRSKDIGTYAETAFVNYLREGIFPLAERRTLSGKLDRGDVNAHRDLVFEVKSVKDISFPGWLREAETERINASAKYGIVIHKPETVGKKNVGIWTAAMYTDSFERLVRLANAAGCLHHEFRRTTGLDNRKALIEAREMAKITTPTTYITAIKIITNKNLPDYYVLQVRDMVELLEMAGYAGEKDQ